MKQQMNRISKLIYSKYIVTGVIIAFLIHSAGSCRKVEPSVDNQTPEVPKVDLDILSNSAKSVETAFISGDVNSVKKILTDDALKLYGTEISKADKNNLIKLGEALKTRQLKVSSNLYAEYTFVLDGSTFSVSMARQEDGSWKLMRY